MTEHTPTPWAYRGDGFYTGEAENPFLWGWDSGALTGNNDKTERADLAFIIRAVNAHDALVAALEDAMPYVARYESENMSNVALATLTKIDAALALARNQ